MTYVAAAAASILSMLRLILFLEVTEDVTDQGAKVNTRALALDFLLETVEKGGYSHVVMRGMLEKYQYLDKKERAFLTRLCEGTLERMLELAKLIKHICIKDLSKLDEKRNQDREAKSNEN